MQSVCACRSFYMLIHDAQVCRPTIRRLNSQQLARLSVAVGRQPQPLTASWDLHALAGEGQSDVSLHPISLAGYPDVPLERPS